MRSLELRVPPVAVGLLAGALMWLVSWWMPSAAFALPGRTLVAALLALVGALVSTLGVLSFRRAGTTVNPMKPESSSSLVISGVYRVTRNPMYLGFSSILLGWGVYLSNGLACLVLPVFVLYMTRFQIEPEERVLESRFGREFADYKGRVRRWI
jgi:protein-S-isoprenylcysteine O-methyltransferase Ste14